MTQRHGWIEGVLTHNAVSARYFTSGDSRIKVDRAGNGIGVGTAIGAVLFVLTNDPVWIALGAALGAALGWRKSITGNSDQKNSDQ